MPIVGFNFTKIYAEKKNSIKKDKKIKINSRLGIINLEKELLPTGKTKAEGLKLDFELLLEYLPKIASIEIKGFIYFIDDQNIIKDLLKGWEKNKSIPVDIQQQVLNSVILKATIKALELEQEINIPPHIPFPSIKPAKKQ